MAALEEEIVDVEFYLCVTCFFSFQQDKLSDDNVCLALQLCKCIFVPTDVTWIQLEVKHLTVGATVNPIPTGVFK